MLRGSIPECLPRQVPHLPQCSYGLDLDQNIDIIWQKRSMLVNDNTAEYDVPRPVTRGGAQEGEAPLQTFSPPPWKNVMGIV